MEKLISIIIPVYNVSNYLRECLDSVISQTYKNLEIILVNDGSTDDSEDICREYTKKDNRVTLINKENGGLSDARNKGLDVAKGEFIMFIDSDDKVDTGIVRQLYSVLVSNDADIAICDPVHVFSPQDIQYTYSNNSIVYSPKEAIAEMWYQHSFLPSAWAKLFRTSLFGDLRFRVGILFEDIDILHELFWKADKIVYNPSSLYAYQHREGSITTKSFSIRDCEILNICDRLVSFAEDKGEALQNAARAYSVVGALRVELNAPDSDEFSEERKRAEKILTTNSCSVINDPNVRNKTRVALRLYKVCKPIMKVVYKRVNRWK